MIDVKDIPYSKIDEGELNIKFPKSVKSINPKFNQLTTEVNDDIEIYNTVLQSVTGFNQLQSVGGWLSINDNTELQSVTGFNQLQSVGSNLLIWDNTVLQSVTGFNQLQSVGGWLWIDDNPNLVTLSIPSTMIRSMNYKKYYIQFEYTHQFKSPKEFVNSGVIIQDCIYKFTPGLHGDVVVKQIVENVELWGTPATINKVFQHLCSKGVNPDLIPAEYLNKYHSDTIQKNNKILSEYLEISN